MAYPASPYGGMPVQYVQAAPYPPNYQQPMQPMYGQPPMMPYGQQPQQMQPVPWQGTGGAPVQYIKSAREKRAEDHLQMREDLADVLDEDNSDTNRKFLSSLNWGAVVPIMSADHQPADDPDEPLPGKSDAWSRAASIFSDEAFKTTSGIAFVVASLAYAAAITFGILLQKYGTSQLTMALIAGGILNIMGYLGISLCLCFASTYSTGNRNVIIFALLLLLIDAACGTFTVIGYINFVQKPSLSASAQSLGVYGLATGATATVASIFAVVRSLSWGRKKEHDM